MALPCMSKTSTFVGLTLWISKTFEVNETESLWEDLLAIAVTSLPSDDFRESFEIVTCSQREPGIISFNVAVSVALAVNWH